ncbi:MAG: hypothetical protein PF795_00410 [Kiritimatiellae bacterium]|jgi:hypothetical protein|nr:hypothetical protein [Kiritimatiellia bacterium]
MKVKIKNPSFINHHSSFACLRATHSQAAGVKALENHSSFTASGVAFKRRLITHHSSFAAGEKGLEVGDE